MIPDGRLLNTKNLGMYILNRHLSLARAVPASARKGRDLGTNLPDARGARQRQALERLCFALVDSSPIVAEHLPEAEGLVGSARHHRLAVGGHRKVQHPRLVTSKLADLDHGRVLPQGELILGEAVRGQDLLLVLAPDEGAHLRVGIDLLQQGAGRRVPEADLAARCQQCHRPKPSDWAGAI